MRRVVVGIAIVACSCALVTDLGGLAGDGGADVAVDSPPDVVGPDAPASIYNDIANDADWSTFDTGLLKPIVASSFSGGAFDGRYVYFAPKPGNLVARYDTNAPFSTATSWATFDPTPIETLWGFQGAVFDGRYVYFVPYNNGSGYTGVVLRYDTQATFTAASAWNTIDANLIGLGTKGFIGGTFDGRYVYFVPHNHGAVARYDTQGGFDASSAWSGFDLVNSGIGTNARGFAGALFDGRWLYLVPNVDGANLPNGLVARCDTDASFTATSSWSTFDVGGANAAAKGFFGGAFDGRYLYLAPDPNATLARYDTTAVFGAPGSWETLDLKTIAASASSFRSAAFDGRYVWFAPGTTRTVVRFDTSASLTATTSWSTHAIAMGDAGAFASTYEGAIFDGRYVYFVPGQAGVPVARFDAKSPPSMPALPHWNGSFY